MILTFCITNATETDNHPGENFGYNYILQKLRNEENSRYYMNKQRYDQGEFDNEVNGIFRQKSYFRKKRSLLEKLALDESSQLLKKNLEHQGDKPKHFWTLIFVKDNNISAYNFVENASFLMKLGFDIRQGNFISFGKCYV